MTLGLPIHCATCLALNPERPFLALTYYSGTALCQEHMQQAWSFGRPGTEREVARAEWAGQAGSVELVDLVEAAQAILGAVESVAERLDDVVGRLDDVVGRVEDVADAIADRQDEARLDVDD